MIKLKDDDIRSALSEIEDPELHRSLTDLDMIKKIAIDGSQVDVVIALTVPGCPFKGKIETDIIDRLRKLEGVETVNVQFHAMTDAEKGKLQQKLHSRVQQIPIRIKPTGIASRCIAICSGKGGVGKSTVTVNLATSLARSGRRVAILDTDFYGYSVPRMLGLSGRPELIEDRIHPLKTKDGLQVMSAGLFVNEREPIAWRGPQLHQTLTQFLTHVSWEPCDVMFLDLPPGTGDITLTILHTLPSAEILLVTTPQAAASNVAVRVAKLASQHGLSLLGVIENMAYLERDGEREYLFGRDGGRDLATDLNLPLLGQIPIRQSIREASDQGRPAAIYGDEADVILFDELSKRVLGA